MDLTRYHKAYSCQEKPDRILLVATRRCAVLELSTALWERISTGGELSEQDQATLVRLGVLVPDRDAEREEMRSTFEVINAESRHYSVTVTLSLECNLACPYCFEDPFRGHFVMSAETADLLVQRLTERMSAGYDVTVDFYGGEALMRLDLLMDSAGRLAAAAVAHGVTFDFNLFSNGVLLTPQTVHRLLPLGLAGVRLTIDGPPDVHNVQRPFVSGSASFEIILANLVAVHKLVPVDLGGNYTRHNYQRFPELLDILIEAGIEPARMKEVSFSPVMPKADGSMAGDLGSACACTAEPWAIEAALFLRGEVIRRGFPVAKIKPSACMIEFANDLVVGYDGSIYKCPVFMGQEEMRVGSLQDGLLPFTLPQPSPIKGGGFSSSPAVEGGSSEPYNLNLWKNDECLECAYLPLCFGGCRFFRKLNTGAIDGTDCRQAMLDNSLERYIRQDVGM